LSLPRAHPPRRRGYRAVTTCPLSCETSITHSLFARPRPRCVPARRSRPHVRIASQSPADA
jgi:hypothetical protein